MTRRMLIDATHAEETRVAVVDGERLEDFDYESIVRKQLKGSIFLAKVTRVEPSLQAAFVDFGGNRHGFLPFNEIHPDYFRIPIADREALLEEQRSEMEARRAREAEEDEAEEAEMEREENASKNKESAAEDDEDAGHDIAEVGGDDAETPVSEEDDTDEEEEEVSANEPNAGEPADEDDEEKTGALEVEDNASESEEQPRERRRRGRYGNRRSSARRRRVEKTDDENGVARTSLRRRYKIQEVIHRGQIMLIQASREERGNKGAAMTTYLSLPGRYGVLMPNSPRGGGVSRKIENYKDRRRMREVLKELNIPDGMSIILRTAGLSRTKAEIKRDLDYLMRLWDSIRELTLQSSAPAVIHEEGSLIRRSIRDVYTRETEEILVVGEDGYKKAKECMKMMIPSQARVVKQYKDSSIPLFQRYGVEEQIVSMADPSAALKSGGSLVINPTEALVSIDVNSGRATRERHIETTALNTNLEAAEEVARQLRLRDLGGLIVIDFIDMEDRRNNRKVENRLRDALSNDRARIQVGRISPFGLLEMSRQRLNPSLVEAQQEICPTCNGTGRVRTVDSAAVLALRSLEGVGARSKAGDMHLYIPGDVALYILNNKRDVLAGIEERYGYRVEIHVESDLGATGFRVEPGKTPRATGLKEKGKKETAPQAEETVDIDENHEEDSSGSSRSSRRRGTRGGRRRSSARQKQVEEQPEAEDDSVNTNEDVPGTDEDQNSQPAEEPVEENTGTSDEAPAETDPVEPSNDTDPVDQEPLERDYETVNAPPDKKKKGWWNLGK